MTVQWMFNLSRLASFVLSPLLSSSASPSLQVELVLIVICLSPSPSYVSPLSLPLLADLIIIFDSFSLSLPLVLNSHPEKQFVEDAFCNSKWQSKLSVDNSAHKPLNSQRKGCGSSHRIFWDRSWYLSLLRLLDRLCLSLYRGKSQLHRAQKTRHTVEGWLRSHLDYVYAPELKCGSPLQHPKESIV